MSSITCPQCDLTTWATALNCKRCGYFFQPVEAAAQTPLPETQPVSSFGGEQNAFGNQQNFQSPNYQSNWSPPPPPPPNYHQSSYQNHQSGYQNHYQPQYQQPKLKLKLAIYSLILGIFSFPVVNLIFGAILSAVLGIIFGTTGAIVGLALTVLILPLGLITGISALRKANKLPQEYGGKGLAITGIVLSAFGLLVMPVMAAIAVPNMLAARRAANEGGAISTMRTLLAAEETYRATYGKGRCGDLQKLAETRLIEAELSSGKKFGYQFLIVSLPTLNGDCEITATPQSTSEGDRSFYVSTEDSVVRAAKKNGLPANSKDSPIGN